MLTFENYEEPIYHIDDGKNGSIVGTHPRMIEAFRLVNALVKRDTKTVLITGETGTGKELFSRALHYNSPTRKGANFKAVNCAGIPSELLESQLFGHKKGSFTGAIDDSIGIFQAADKGTLLLDEIGDMPPLLQAKLLRVLETRKVTPVGSSREQELNVRVVAATNRNLEQMIQEGAFRADLLHRLNTVVIDLPALRDRQTDVLIIADHLLKLKNERYGLKVQGFSKDASQALLYHPWPGNIRDLDNVLERAILNRSDGLIQIEELGLVSIKSTPADEEGHIYRSNPNYVFSFELPEKKVGVRIYTKSTGFPGNRDATPMSLDEANKRDNSDNHSYVVPTPNPASLQVELGENGKPHTISKEVVEKTIAPSVAPVIVTPSIPLEERVVHAEARETTSQQTGSKLWYEDGVLPISSYRLRLQGADGFAINRLAGMNNIAYSHSIRSKGNGQHRLFYLTADTLVLPFLTTNHSSYGALLKELNEGAFNQIVRKPFKFFLPKEIKEIVGSSKDQTFSSYLADNNSFKVRGGSSDSQLYALNEAEISKVTRNQRAQMDIMKQITDNYQVFRAWQPTKMPIAS
jgi:hypothetical protein